MNDTTKTSRAAPTRSPAPMIIAVVVAIAILGGVAVILFGGGDDDVEVETSGDGIPTADDALTPAGGADSGEAVPEVSFTYFDGSEGSFADFEGKPTVVNFFASWCGPCIQEMPDFEEVFQAYGDQVNFVGLNTQDRVEDGRAIADQTGVTYTLASDADGSIHAAFGGFGMPTTVFVTADGTIIDMHTGLLQGEALEQVITEDMLS
jgi:thiol-disulfide isomerase/thioredoxin